MSVLEQGDVIEVGLTPAVGHKPAKLRPAVVVSGYGFNSRSSLVAVVPVSPTCNGYPLHVRVRAGEVSGYAVVAGLRTLDIRQRGYRYLGPADETAMRSIMTNIRGILDLR
jgi:mRNA interferase MazF